jgi:hypothetical protein
MSTKRSRYFTPRLECLEDRTLLTAYHVTMLGNANTEDLNDATGNSGTLRYIIDTRLAQNAGDRNTIDFQVSGTISLTAALQTIGHSVDIIGPGRDNLTIERNAAAQAQFRIFNFNNALSILVSGLTIQGGRTANQNDGAGVNARFVGNLTIANCEFADNISRGHGGAVAASDTTVVAIYDSSFTDNQANEDGGALSVYARRTFTVSNDTFISNHSRLSGGAISAVTERHGSIVIDRSSFQSNTADTGNGGGVHIGPFVRPNEYLTISRSVFEGNRALEGYGGAVANGDINFGASGIIHNCTMNNNLAALDGGAIYDYENILFLIGNTVTVNEAGRSGGVIYIANINGPGIITSCIVANNTSGQFGPDLIGTFGSWGFNIIGNGADSAGWLAGPILFDSVGTWLNQIDAGLGELGFHGGTSKTHSLLGTSSALNAGNDSYGSGFDQRGYSRSVGSHVDIGAVEMQSGETSLTAPFAYNVAFSVMLNGIVRLPYDGDYTLLDYSGNDPLEVTISAVNGDPGDFGEEIATLEGGTVTLEVDGTFVYVAPTDYVGSDSFTYTVSDGLTTRTGTVTLNIINTIAYDSGYSVLRDDPLTVTAGANGLLMSAFAASGDPITITEVNGSDVNLSEPTATSEGGSVTVEADGSFVYTPDTSFEGDDTFTVTYSDGISSSIATVTIHVVKVLAGNAGFEMLQNDELDVPNLTYVDDLLDFAEDADSDPLTVVEVNGDDGAVSEEIETANGGTVTVEANGEFVYNPPTNWAGDDWFTYTVSDGATGFSTATAIITVIPINNAPVGTSDTVSMLEDVDNVITISDFGFTDPNNTPVNGFLAVKIISLPGAGTLKLDGVAVSVNDFIDVEDIYAELLTFTPATNASGASYSSFTYKVKDDGGTSNGGVDLDATARTMTIDVTAVNDAPVNSVPGSQSLNEDASLVFSSSNGNLISISDIDAGTNTVQVEIGATHGVNSLSGTSGLSFSFSDAEGTGTGDGIADAIMRFRGTLTDINAALAGLTYTPDANYNGSALVSVKTNDLGNTGPNGASHDSDIVITTIASVNDAPTGANNTVYTSQNTDYVFQTSDFGFSDVDANAFLAVKITELPASGTLSWYNGSSWVAVTLDQYVSASDIANGRLKYTPPTSFTGNRTFKFRNQDDGGTANGGIDLDLYDRTMTINVS